MQVGGGVGLRNAVRGTQTACWSSWADSLHMIRKRHPDISDFTVTPSRGGGVSETSEFPHISDSKKQHVNKHPSQIPRDRTAQNRI